MDSMNVTFRNTAVEIEDLKTGNNQKQMETIEITFPDGRVGVYPADAVNEESGKKYCDLFEDKYKSFKGGKADPDQVQRLEREIEDRKTQLEALNKNGVNDVVPIENPRIKGDHGGHDVKPLDSADQPSANKDRAQASNQEVQADNKDQRVQENLGYGGMKNDPPITDHNTAAKPAPAKFDKKRR